MEWKLIDHTNYNEDSTSVCNVIQYINNTSIEMCNLRGDDVFNLNQIVINAIDKFHPTDKRKQTGYNLMTRIVEDGYIEIIKDNFNDSKNPFHLQAEIKPNNPNNNS